MTRMIIALLALGLLAGCAADSPTAPTQAGASPAVLASASAAAEVDGAVACQTVRGTITAQSFAGGAVGTIQGDLQGTITTVTGPDPVGATDGFATGRATHLTGHQTVEVQSSSIPDLVGRTIVWSIDSRSMGLPPNLQVSSTLRILSGATGNLVSHGILDLTTRRTEFEYEGVVCP